MCLLAGLLVGLGAGIGWAERLDTAATIVLENDVIQVELYADRPAPMCYLHKPTGERMAGSGPDGVWRMNGQDLPWPRWRVEPFRRSDKTAAAYEMALMGTGLRLQVRFVLRDNALEMRFENIADPGRVLRTLEWVDMPMLSCRRADYVYWREVWRGARWTPGARPVWSCRPDSGLIGDAAVDGQQRPTIHACVYKPEEICAFVTSNSRFLPLLDGFSNVCGADAYSVSLNTYYACPDGQGAQPLRAWVVFLQDLNEDGQCDRQDYAVWMNRHLPDPPDAALKTALWYRLDVGADGVANLEEAADVVRRIANATGRIPQVCQLAGWDEDGGGTEKPADFVASAKNNNALVSCRTSIPEGLPARRYLASLDESGVAPAVERVDVASEFLSTVHLASFRGGNAPEGWYGGLTPALDELRRRGVSVTADSSCGLPVEMAGMFSGVWRFEPPLDLLPLYHGKVVAGCAPETAAVPFGYGCGLDLSGAGADREWNGVLDQIYLRALLYHFYLEREWLDTEQLPGGAVRLRFSHDTTVVAGPGRDDLTVATGGVTVAVGADRFIPRGEAIYAYSRDGSTRWWNLPSGWDGQELRATTLSVDGPAAGSKLKAGKGRIRLRLEPHSPVTITRQPK